MTIYHSCLRKIKIIYERTGILLGHDEISLLCEMWQTMNPSEFMRYMDSLTDEELKKEIEKIRKKRKFLENYLAQEQMVYA
jgi:hypothetical protein